MKSLYLAFPHKSKENNAATMKATVLQLL